MKLGQVFGTVLQGRPVVKAIAPPPPSLPGLGIGGFGLQPYISPLLERAELKHELFLAPHLLLFSNAPNNWGHTFLPALTCSMASFGSNPTTTLQLGAISAASSPVPAPKSSTAAPGGSSPCARSACVGGQEELVQPPGGNKLCKEASRTAPSPARPPHRAPYSQGWTHTPGPCWALPGAGEQLA